MTSNNSSVLRSPPEQKLRWTKDEAEAPFSVVVTTTKDERDRKPCIY